MRRQRIVQVDKEAMAEGYKEMAELNLSISKEEFLAEEEGWRLSYEMASKKMDKQAE